MDVYLYIHKHKLTRALTSIFDLIYVSTLFFRCILLPFRTCHPTMLWLKVCMLWNELMKPQATVLELRYGDDSYKGLVSSPLSNTFCIVNIKLMVAELQWALSVPRSWYCSCLLTATLMWLTGRLEYNRGIVNLISNTCACPAVVIQKVSCE